MNIGFPVNPSPVHPTLRIHSWFLYMLAYPAAVKANTRRPKVLYILYVNSEIPKPRGKQTCGRLWCVWKSLSQPRSNAWWFTPLCSRHALWPHPVCHLLHMSREDLHPIMCAVWKCLDKEEEETWWSWLDFIKLFVLPKLLDEWLGNIFSQFKRKWPWPHTNRQKRTLQLTGT